MSEQARRTPDAVAVSCGGEQLTYADLEASATRLAIHLVERGVGPDRVVALLAERSPRLITALLAILKAGGAYLALEPDAPQERLVQLVSDAEPVLLLAETGPWERLAEVDVPTEELNRLLAEPTHSSLRAAPTTPENLAYVSYTSGSTGEPKGVCVPHRAVARLVQQPDWAQFTSADVFLQLAPVAFDASTLEIWTPLTLGGRLAVQPPGRTTPDTLAQTLRAEQVSVLWLTAGFFHQMVDAHLEALGGLRHILAGGDVLSRDHVSRVLTAHPHLAFTNGYGPTENTTFTACWTVRGPVGADGPVPIGRPVSGTGVAILDTDRRPVPVGAEGELYAFGDGLARGYLGRPEATAERFVLAAGPTGAVIRMYRTGDLARWQADGTIEFLGRADRQIKIQGFRVEPGAIEAALTRLPTVSDSAVVARSDDSGAKRLLAYAVPSPEALADPELAAQLREQLRDVLPPYMVPQSVIVLPTLPLGPTGKVDRSALPDPRRAPRTCTAPYRAPDTPLERSLAELWSDLLAVEPIGADDDFFELGGHSLLAARALHATQREHGVRLAYFDLLEQPTVAGLAATIEELTP
ncbi:amino acid adenylation domain-containing protein [Kitasatospora sp. LaBMicrA B282]|uniref:amino acid adenylation domain-containing protein n=1 Tax=Kitasatospora sp. LaBMicrA B282 TaxID=3420949 RepID=UPI003D0F5AF9